MKKPSNQKEKCKKKETPSCEKVPPKNIPFKYKSKKKDKDKINIDNDGSETNSIFKKSISKELQNFLIEKPIFPCLLVSKDDYGKIEMNMNCLEGIDIDKIKIIKEECSEIVKREDNIDNQIIDFSNYQFDISVIHNSLNFSKNVNSIQKISEKNNLIIGKYKLYSFNINEGDLIYNQYFKEKFENIANDVSSDETKAKKIDEIFQDQGYFIPLKIYIGGLFLNRYNKKEKTEIIDSFINVNIDSDFKIEEIKNKEKLEVSSEKEISKIFLNENTQIIGGEKTEKDFEKWTKSVKISNSNIIECTNIIEAKNIIPNEVRKKLKIPLQLVEQKYLERKKYFEKIKSLKDIELEQKIGYNNISKGICEETDIPKIYIKKIELYVERPLLGYRTKTILESFIDIIVGFKIVSERNDNYNGQWTFNSNPLLKKEINITFVSQFSREQKYSIYIYLMKFPE